MKLSPLAGLVRKVSAAAIHIPGLAFFGGLVAQTVGVALVYLPAGIILGGVFACALAVLWLLNEQPRP